MAKPDREAYLAYLESPQWSALRRKVWLRCHGICEGCGERPVADVHHLSYKHFGNEFLWELAGLCVPCHERLHGIVRG